MAPSQAAATAGVAQRPAVTSRDGLQRIGGITPEIEKLLNVQGISRYSQIAQWATNDIERFDRLLGYQGRIQRENWIEQAQILARGGDTAYSREHDRRTAAVAKPAQPVARVQAPSTPVPSSPVKPAVTGTASIAAAAVAAAATAATAAAARPAATPAPAPAPAAAPTVAPAVSPPATVVASTAGASATAAASVAAATSASDAAAAGAAQASARPSRLADAIRSKDVRAGDPAPAARPGDLSSLRSVRSEALRGGPVASGARPAELHDLKRVRGIGVLIEKKLNSMGVTRYEQIAEWTVAEIERVSQALDFKGRIERENWVEQARILASGGQTEFSRRADRGEGGGA